MPFTMTNVRCILRIASGARVEMMKGDRRPTFSEAGGDLVIQNRPPATQLGMLSNSEGMVCFNAGTTGLITAF
jgi:hypothetical protein